MKGIDVNKFEELLQKKEVSRSENLLGCAYRNCKNFGYDGLVINEGYSIGMSDCDIVELDRAMTELGVSEFVLADESTALMRMIHAFTKVGYSFTNVTTVSQEGKPFYNPEYDQPKKGLLFERGEWL